jgi:hypothetical protein
MRQMINSSGTIVDVIEHIILGNYWEYYILEAADENGIAFALVVGDYTEMGSVSMDEIAPHIVSRTANLDIMPAPEWSWGFPKARPDESDRLADAGW